MRSKGVRANPYRLAGRIDPAVCQGQRWPDRIAVRGEVIVQFWLRPGEAAVTLGVGEEREVERIPEQLRRFLGGGEQR